ncbi:MAG: NADH-quinone oxidoreductase subunit N [Chloroflexi bacterium]|nr:NADH-quinone oxidoreductase subunit N [Chloroflexota bacterium]MQC28052.1 NADH-quinone oxidoreductase subunit N [Chloroflexota bacterium]
MNWYDQIHHIGPAFALLVGAGVVMGADLVMPRRAPVLGLSLVALLAAAGWALWQVLAGTEGPAISGAIVVDDFALFFTFLLISVTGAVVIVTYEGLSRIEARPEFFALLLTATGAMILLAQAQDLIAIFVFLETTAIAQFVLAGIARDDRSSEAGLKYLLTGAVAAAVLLYGFAFLFGLAGTTSLEGIAAFVAEGSEGTELALVLGFVLVAAGLGFKLTIAPFQAWVPDVYEGAPTTVTSFLSVASKAAGFAIVLRIFYTGLGGGDTFIAQHWAGLFAVLAGVSMTFGNVAAILQTNVKRLLAYSSIAQAGNIAVGLAAVAAGSTVGPAAVLFFLGTYAATNLGAFFCVIVVSERIGSERLEDYAGLVKRSPAVAVVLLLCLLSLTGLPPTAGFLAKLFIFNSGIQTNHDWMVWLVAIAVLNSAISAFYYLRWARTMLLDEPTDPTPFRPTAPVQGLLGLAAAAVLFFGLVPTPLLDAAQRAAASLL